MKRFSYFHKFLWYIFGNLVPFPFLPPPFSKGLLFTSAACKGRLEQLLFTFLTADIVVMFYNEQGSKSLPDSKGVFLP